MCVFKEETMLCISSLVGTKEKMVSYVSPPSYGLRHYLIINLSNLIPPLHNRNQHSTFRTEKNQNLLQHRGRHSQLRATQQEEKKLPGAQRHGQVMSQLTTPSHSAPERS